MLLKVVGNFSTALLDFFYELVSILILDRALRHLALWLVPCCLSRVSSCPWSWSSDCSTKLITFSKEIRGHLRDGVLLMLWNLIILACLELKMVIHLDRLQRGRLSLLPLLRHVMCSSVELILVEISSCCWATLCTHHAINCILSSSTQHHWTCRSSFPQLLILWRRYGRRCWLFSISLIIDECRTTISKVLEVSIR